MFIFSDKKMFKSMETVLVFKYIKEKSEVGNLESVLVFLEFAFFPG